MEARPEGSSRPIAASFCRWSNESLHLILLPTEACNFRCVYCYEDFKYKRMEPWVVEGVKNLITRRSPDLERLDLSWFGGEPLLARDIVSEIQSHARSVASGRPSMRVGADMTTNGYVLCPAVLQQLIDSGVASYQISFDGPREFHDRKRVLHGGKGTFDVIWGNLLAARSLTSRFNITIRIHVDRSNEAVVPRFIDECAAAFGSDSRFELFIRELSRLGGPNDSNLDVFENGDGRPVTEELRRHAAARGLRLMESKDAEEAACYAARANSFLIRANGRVGKCTVALEHPHNQVGVIREDGTLDLMAPRMAMWMRGLKSDKREELRCPMEGYADSTADLAADLPTIAAHEP